MRIIVADDEYFARYSLISILCEIGFQETDIREAENGEELITLLKDVQADVIFLDIRMPKLGGLEAFSRLRDSVPETQWVIVSGYADFSYAKQAMQLGAKDYLMKPVGAEDLRKLLDSLKENQKDYIRNSVQNFEADVSWQLQHAEAESQYEDRCFCATVLYDKFELNAGDVKKEQLSSRKQLFEQSVSYSDSDCIHGFVMLPGGLPALISAGGISSDEVSDKHHAVLSEAATDTGVFFCTEPCLGIGQLRKELKELEEYLSYSVLQKNGAKTGLGQLRKIEKQQPQIYDFCNIVQRLVCEYKDHDAVKYATLCKKAKEKAEKLKLSMVMKDSLKEYLIAALGKDGWKEDAAHMPDWEKLEGYGEKQIFINRGSISTQKIAVKVSAYIEMNYDKDISVTSIADMFGITPNYLSAVFKSEMGKTYVQYVTGLRIARAKTLLAESNLTNAAIAEQVGYHNAAYFSRVFKENTGKYPVEFRRELKKTIKNVEK